jgi:hypothetical protein
MKGEFYTDYNSGKAAEVAVFRALTEKGHNLTDVSGHKQYQQLDIDFLLTKNGNCASLEVKNDLRSEETNRVFLETKCGFTLGWFHTCYADYVAFCQMGKGIAHIVALDELREKALSGKYTEKTNRWQTASGIPFPISALEQMESYYQLQLGGKDDA